MSIMDEAVPAAPVAETDVEPKQDDAQLILQFERWVAAAKKKDKDAFKRMRDDADFAFKFGVGAQWPGQSENDDRYVANLVQRHIQMRVSALYAKHPTVVARKRRRMEYLVWDGEVESAVNAQLALQVATESGLDVPADAVELLMDIQKGGVAKKQARRTGETLEILFNYALKEQVPSFKRQFKQMVRRVQTCGLAWVRLGYQRQMGQRREEQAEVADITRRLQHIEGLQTKLGVDPDDDADEMNAAAAELRYSLAALRARDDVVLREGLTFDFPRTPRVLVDPKCTDLLELVGARWVAEEFSMTAGAVQEAYQVDVSKQHAPRDHDDTGQRSDRDPGEDPREAEDEVLVYHLWDKLTGLEYAFCKGHPKFLRIPAEPVVKTERFFSHYALAFNAIEHDEERYPPSDVRLLRHIQREYNRKKEAERQHRIANRPLYAAAKGAFTEKDIESGDHPSLSNYGDHDVILLEGLAEGEDVNKKLQPVQKHGVDPNLYETAGTYSDMQRVVGSQEANLGGTSGATATESSIAESSRLSSLASNVDDIDDLLSSLARDGGAVLLQEMDISTVTEIAGPGAVWPQLSRADIAKQVYLDIEAGSSGRPNQAQDIANFERMAPFIVQTPGIQPAWLSKRVVRLIDDRVDLEEAVADGIPSIVAQNQAAQPSTGDASTDPGQQGGKGRDNAEKQPGQPQGAQPEYPV
ncbi:MAG: hypothetical protein RJQ08_03835 [Salinisphaeraceae bacterium]